MSDLITKFVVAGIIQDDEGRIFIQQRRSNVEYPNKWELPGGKVEDNEDLQSALSRELQEEGIGHVVEHGPIIAAIEKTSIKKYQYILLFMKVKLHNTVCICREDLKAAQDFAWIRKHQLEAIELELFLGHPVYDLIHGDLQVLLTLPKVWETF